MVDDDEIARLARECLALGPCACTELLEARVSRAVAIGTWEEINRWQRVKLRVMRMQRVRDMTERAERRQQAALG
jgi:hypothetical protein